MTTTVRQIFYWSVETMEEDEARAGVTGYAWQSFNSARQ
tara:strand:+ start:11484 stop:11600 length:117 start_codon:yes stop_codon:yes gene_type:complete